MFVSPTANIPPDVIPDGVVPDPNVIPLSDVKVDQFQTWALLVLSLVFAAVAAVIVLIVLVEATQLRIPRSLLKKVSVP